MNPDIHSIYDLGAAGLMTLLILKMVFDFLKARKNGPNTQRSSEAGALLQAEIRKTVMEAMIPTLSALQGIQVIETAVHTAVTELVVLTRQIANRS